MRLIGFSFAQGGSPLLEPSPLGRGYLPLGDLTGVLGPNDSGKTHLLSLLHRALDPQRKGGRRAMLYAICTAKEFLALTGHALADLRRYEDAGLTLETEPFPGTRTVWWKSDLLRADELDSVELSSNRDAMTAWREALIAAVAADPDAWRAVLDAATEGARAALGDAGQPRAELREPLIALEPAQIKLGPRARARPGWNLFWCLPPVDYLPEEVGEALERCGLRPGDDEPDIWRDRWASGRDPRVIPDDDQRRLTAAPVLVAPVGRTQFPIAPSPLRLPVEFEDVRAKIENAVGRVVSICRWVDALLESGSEALWEEDERRIESSSGPVGPQDAWAEPIGDDGWRVPVDAVAGCRLIEAAAESLLLPSIADQYTLRCRVRPPTEWASGGKIDLRLRSTTGDSPASFPVGEAAEGHRLWLQLALLEAAAVLERYSVPIRWWSHQLEDALVAADEDEAKYADYLEEVRAGCRPALDEIRGLDHLDVSPQGDVDGNLAFIPPGRPYRGLEDEVELARGRLYVLDEPERHLHPRLQREAARWLADMARRDSSQVVIATHAVAFMGIGAGAQYTYLTRAGASEAVLSEISPRDLTHIDMATDELGLSRGELMALISVFLWVEGPMDQVVIETLFNSRLRNAGIEVAPMSGHSRAAALLDAPLLRFTEAKIAVWLDNIPQEFLDDLKRNPEFAREAAITETVAERKSLAKLVSIAQMQEKEIHPLGATAARDVFDLLDEETIAELYAGYPGHEDAWAAWRTAMDGGAKVSARKGFYEAEFKTPINFDSCRRIAERMREKGRIPAELAAIVEDCERLSLGLP